MGRRTSRSGLQCRGNLFVISFKQKEWAAMLKEKVLYLLEQNKDRVITGGEIAKLLGVSRNAVWKAVNALKKSGNDIEILRNRGYRLAGDNDGLSKKIIQEMLTTKKLGSTIELFETIHSTNTYFKEQDLSTLEEGHVVLADEQTSGRGRMNRSFFSPKRSGVYLSVLLKPNLPPEKTRLLTICAAVAVSNALQKVCDLKSQIKWVNDIFVNGKKLCGILTEASIMAEMQLIDYVIVGIGINTGQVPKEVENIATSVFEATGKQGFRNKLVAEVLNQFEKIYFDYTLNGNEAAILSSYSEKLIYINKRVVVNMFGSSFEATVLGIDETGGLVVKNDDDRILHINSGEIFLKTAYQP
jgi:BirA family biotin operon repressor/biotin-[acetyl-CoA-carboxylase] ligase